MSRVSLAAGAVSLVFLLACMGGEVKLDAPVIPSPPAPAPADVAPTDDGGKAEPVDGTDKVDAAPDVAPAAAADICCKYATDPAHADKGSTYQSMPQADCDGRKGHVADVGSGTCADLGSGAGHEPAPKPAPHAKPHQPHKPKGPMVRPGTDGGGNGATRPSPKSGGMVRPGG